MKTFKQFVAESIDKALYKKDIKSGAKMLAAKTPKDFNNEYETKGTANIIGHAADSHHHIAALSQVLRNPNYETLHHVYMRGDRVVGHTAMSNRLPSIVQPFATNEDFDNHLHHMKQHMKNLDADGYYLVHNHPSGNPTPSDADHNLTNAYQQNVHGFRGHVIVNHKTFSTIHPFHKETDDQETHFIDTKDARDRVVGKHTLHKLDQSKSYDMTNHSMPHDSIGKSLHSPDKVAEIAKTFQNPNHATVIGASAKLNVNAAAHIPIHLLHGDDEKSSLAAHARIRKFIKMTGSGGNVMIGVPHDDDVEKLGHLVRSGLANDVVSHSGKSARWSGIEPKDRESKYRLAGSIKHFHKQET